jgi:two-component system, chemotaxis family, protein-glutamate methylesterase/glutaminase
VAAYGRKACPATAPLTGHPALTTDGGYVATVHVAGVVPSPPVSVVLVAATATRARQLERLIDDPDFALAGVARDPETAERLVAEKRPSAVLVDLDLLDGGLEAIERIMATRPTPIVVCGDAANQPRAALAAGAVDVVGPLDPAAGAAEFAEALHRGLKMASRVPVITHPRARLRARHTERVDRTDTPGAAELADRREQHGRREQVPGRERVQPAAGTEPAPDEPVKATAGAPAVKVQHDDRVGPGASADVRKRKPLVVAIGASTGGPPALAAILRALPVDLGVAILVVQHMAEGFLEGLARWLDDSADLTVGVAKDGERLISGNVYLAPAGLNLVLRPGYRVELSSPPDGQYHVPGVDVTFASVARLCGPNAVGVLLTGMGRDGAQGLLAMRQAGARTLGQDEASSVVWGMPAAARALDAVELELPLSEMAAAICCAVEDARASQQASGSGS